MDKKAVEEKTIMGILGDIINGFTKKRKLFFRMKLSFSLVWRGN